MKAVEIYKNTWRIGVNMKSTDLFEGMWPIPSGVSINSYALKGSGKTALIDLTHFQDNHPSDYEDQLSQIGMEPGGVDYLIVNHMEPDHSGYLAEFAEKNPRAEILGTKKCLELITAFTGITEPLREVKTGDILDLGDRTLIFYQAPNVHWPETMVTFEEASGILFSCDAFGSYGAVADDKIFDDQNSDEELDHYESETLRYYANIVANFSPFVQRALKALSELKITMVAPSHGLIWRRDPQRIIGLYERYASYSGGQAEKEITLIWGSMYGNTKALVEAVAEGVRSQDVPLHIYRVPEEEHGFILADAWRSRGIILGMPTYEYKMFPPMAHVLDELIRKNVKKRLALRFGSFGWSGGAQKELDRIMEKSGWEFAEPIEWAGKPGEAEFAAARKAGAELARRIKAGE